ncbi:MAG: hypothetical protein HYY26_01435 [Acidobacteria bacterium]|nr:hypothetical protein [Acidobacteriota bacterium]
MNWLLRLAALLAAFWLLLAVLRWFWRALAGRLLFYSSERVSRPPARHGTFKRDPVCGTYVDVELAVSERQNGAVVHFCSEHCRDAYRARSRAEVPDTR